MAADVPIPSKRTWLSWGIPAISFVIVIGLLTVIILVLCEVVGTGITGKEFNPYTFETREFDYRQSLITQRQIKGITRTKSQSDVAFYISSQTWFPQSKQTRWDLAEDSTVTGDSLDWRSQPLVRLFENQAFKTYWLDWSAEHPDLDKSLWLAVVELAREDQYEAVPLIFDAVYDIEDKELFLDTIDQTLTAAYLSAVDTAKDPQKATHFQNLADDPFRNRLP